MTNKRGEDLTMSKLDKDQVISDLTQAYEAKHGKQPSIEAKGGWYSVDGGKNVRLAALQEMTEDLQSGAKSKTAEKPAAKSKAAPSKKAKAAPAKAKKATGKTKGSPPKTAGFSVKDFWAEQILEKNAGSKLPR